MYSLQRRVLSQNFFYSRKLVSWLLRKSSIGPKDTVLDIGAGKGIITELLLKITHQVIAIEIDALLCSYLENKFKTDPHVQVINKDFLRYLLPLHPYKVFANIPFCIEGEIIRKLLTAHNPPDDSYLVMRRDLALRLSGIYKENRFSILYKPWFTFQIIHSFRRTDFEPMARMDTVLLRFTKRPVPLLPIQEQKEYRLYIEHGFKDGRSIKQNLKCVFTHTQLEKLATSNGFQLQDKPSYLSLDQWISLYKFAKRIGKV